MAVDDDYTKLLLHMDGDDDDTIFVDEAGKSVTVNGDVVTKTGIKKFGSASGYFDGNGDYLSFGALSDLYVGTGKFCFDMWIYPTSFAGSNKVFLSYGNYSSGFVVYTSLNGILYLYNAGGNRITGPSLAVNTWYHIAIIGNGETDGNRKIYLYVNGVVKGTWTVNYNMNNQLVVGTNVEAPTTQGFIGYMDEFRASIGIERWTANFPPPSAPYGPSPPVSEGLFFATFI